MLKTLSIIGGGNVGKTLGRLWAGHRVFTIRDVLTRSPASAARATEFIGTGRAVSSYAALQSADIYLIATPDDQIMTSCERLVETGRLSSSSIVFHCSGAHSSQQLAAARSAGAAVASVHPVRSFAAPEHVANDFSGTFCGTEGDPLALDVLVPAFVAIGAKPVTIQADKKILYHAAAVFASNYLATLLSVAQDAYGAAGIAPDMALQVMEPLVRANIDNIFRLGPAAALSGPIARGDMITVEKQHRALSDWDHKRSDLYAQFVQLTVELAAMKKP